MIDHCGDPECKNPHAGEEYYRGFRINEFWMYTAIEASTDQEGIIMIPTEDGTRPAFATDELQRDMIRPTIMAIAAMKKQKDVMVRHFKLEDTEELDTSDLDPVEMLKELMGVKLTMGRTTELGNSE